MDTRERTILLCAVFAAAIAVSVLLRSGKKRTQYLMALLAGISALKDVGIGLHGIVEKRWLLDGSAAMEILFPIVLLLVFESIGGRSKHRRAWLLPIMAIAGAAALAYIVTRDQWGLDVWLVLFAYSAGFGMVVMVLLALSGHAHRSRAVRERTGLLVVFGSLSLVFSMCDYLWCVDSGLSQVSSVLAVLFLYALEQSTRREDLCDLMETLERLLAFTVLAFALAAIFYGFVAYLNFETMYLSAVSASIAIMVLIDPLRNDLHRRIHAILFRQSVELRRQVDQLQERLANVVHLEEMAEIVIGALQQSRRATSAALYLVEPDRRTLVMHHGFGLNATAQLDVGAMQPLLQRLEQAPSIKIDELAQYPRITSYDQHIEENEKLWTVTQLLGEVARSGVVLAVRASSKDLVGILVVQDGRVTDAFNAGDMDALERMAMIVGLAVETSHAYMQLNERDRLADLGKMAAGLAHEIKNPLGSIKGAAQLLADGRTQGRLLQSPCDGASHDEPALLDIIIEEVDRLDRVVRSVLEYARSSQELTVLVDVNATVTRAFQIIKRSVPSRIAFELELDAQVGFVRMDAEQLRQVLVNFVQNAAHAIGDNDGMIRLSTRLRPCAKNLPLTRLGTPSNQAAPSQETESQQVEVTVQDTGTGMDEDVLKHIFVPFFSTKPDGTGLGLSICQRIADRAGCCIEVASQLGAGSTFRFVCPMVKAPPRATAPTNTPPNNQPQAHPVHA